VPPELREMPVFLNTSGVFHAYAGNGAMLGYDTAGKRYFRYPGSLTEDQAAKMFPGVPWSGLSAPRGPEPLTEEERQRRQFGSRSGPHESWDRIPKR